MMKIGGAGQQVGDAECTPEIIGYLFRICVLLHAQIINEDPVTVQISVSAVADPSSSMSLSLN